MNGEGGQENTFGINFFPLWPNVSIKEKKKKDCVTHSDVITAPVPLKAF